MCTDVNDLYTKVGTIKGNKRLSQPIGLITADEAGYAGGIYSTNNNDYYLSNGNTAYGAGYWTMSPYGYDNNYSNANVVLVSTISMTHATRVTNSYDVRPVINLRADISFKSGNGTINQPFEV